jgi:hypothetical protein
MDFDVHAVFTGRSLDKLRLVDRGDLLLTKFLRPCRLKILMVVDGHPGSFLNVSFSHSYFGLSAVLDTLRDNPEYFVKFNITRAHRQVDDFKPDPATEPLLHARYGPHFENFRFTQAGFDINAYDQVWLFGARSDPAATPDAQRLTDAELQVLATWMDTRKGGLFATGDHADLGASLCARVPRASTMRRWTNAQGVPPQVGPNRHDTNRKGHDAFYTFDDESDDIPMRISPRYYPLGSWSPFRKRRAPHPVLCGTDGVIDVLPDHPHEGHVFEDADVVLTRNLTYGTYSAPEYPAVGGVQTRPEVIAHAHVLGDHTNASDLNKGAADAKTFGAVGAYNGHAANVGRVVVDSTWHHWFDVNLTGRPAGSLDSLPSDDTNPKTLGYLATAAGTAAYARIQNYFRNVAMWLATPAKQSCMFLRATYGAVIRYPLVERLHPDLAIWVLGESARDAIGRRAGQCNVSWWLHDIYPDLRDLFAVEKIEPFPDPNPCLTCPPPDLFEIYALGGITRELLALAYREEDSPREVDEAQVARAFVRGVGAGVKALGADYQRSLGRGKVFAQRFSAAVKEQPSERAFLGGDAEEKPTTVAPARKPPAPAATKRAAKKSSKKGKR